MPPKKLTPKGQAAPPVEPNIAQARIPRKAPTKRAPVQVTEESETMYVRNLHQIKARVTLETGREIQLEPRGQREDLDIVTAEERNDPRFLSNLGLIFELVEPEAAREIISKQQTNARSQEHPLWAHLRNAQGKQYSQRVMEIEEAFERQGIVVGRVEESGSGRFTDKNQEIVRSAGPNFTQAPGSPGHPATEQMLNSVPGDISPEEFHEFLLWKQFKEMKAKGETS